MDIMYSGSAVALADPRLMMHLKERDHMRLYVYGSCNAVDRNSFESAAWCLKAYSIGADGVLPWQSVGGDKAFDQPEQVALLVSAKRFAQTAVPSMRVMALRHGAQQCELLAQVLDRNRGWNRWHAYALVTQKVPLAAVFPSAPMMVTAWPSVRLWTDRVVTTIGEALVAPVRATPLKSH